MHIKFGGNNAHVKKQEPQNQLLYTIYKYTNIYKYYYIYTNILNIQITIYKYNYSWDKNIMSM